jgi:hypothetical protein
MLDDPFPLEPLAQLSTKGRSRLTTWGHNPVQLTHHVRQIVQFRRHWSILTGEQLVGEIGQHFV